MPACPAPPSARPGPSQIRSASQPVQLQSQKLPQQVQQQQSHQPQQPQQSSQLASANKDGVWADLISLQTTNTSSLPLQYQSPQSLPQQLLANNSPAFSSSPTSYQPRLQLVPHSGFMSSFPSSSPSFSHSPISPLPMHSQIQNPQQFVQSSNIAQPLAHNGFLAQQPVHMNNQFPPPSPQPMVTSTTPQLQNQFQAPSPHPQFMPQTYWPQQGFGPM